MAPKGLVGGKVYGSELRICAVQRDQCTVTSRLTDPTLVLRGNSSEHFVTLFPGQFDPHSPPRSANNVVPYTFVMLFSRRI